MSSLSFLTPLALALSALAIPIILLYMLRLRRTETPISSTFLWQQLVRDREANAPWQRLRFSWLLLLQLLILAALVLALARPFTRVDTITTGRIVLLLDASASMNATDVRPNRFAAARDVGLDIVETLGPDDTMTVIRVSEVPEVLASASRDPVVLRDAINSARPGSASVDWEAARALAEASAEGVSDLNVVIVSDGGLPDDLTFVSGNVEFVMIGREASNRAISALSVASLPGKAPQFYAQISNYGDAEAEVLLDGRYDGSDVIDWAYRYTVPANGYIDVTDVELRDVFDSIEVRLSLPRSESEPDHLAADDEAYAVLYEAGVGNVLLVTEDNRFLRAIFQSLRGTRLFEATPDDYARLAPNAYDLYVFDGWLPLELPAANLLIVNPPNGADFFALGLGLDGLPASVQINEGARADWRVRNLEDESLARVNLAEFRALEDTPWATTLLQIDGVLPGQSSEDAVRYPLVVAGEVAQRQVVILPFDATNANTDFVFSDSWPILFAELADWYAAARVTDITGSITPGMPVRVRFPNEADEVIITRPDGATSTLRAGEREAVFSATQQQGVYHVALRRGGEVIKEERFTVNLFNDEESRIVPVERTFARLNGEAVDVTPETGRREWWPWIAGLGLAVLAVEWWLYHRSLRRMPRVTLAGLRQAGQREQNRLRALLTRRRRRRSPGRVARSRWR